MTERIIIAGSGGQGVMLLGKVIAQSAMLQAKQVTWFPAYGAEVRGGTSYCMVIISDEPIGSPYVFCADTLIILNSPSLDKFKHRLKKNGLLILNSSLAEGLKDGSSRVRQFPFTDIALKLGNVKVANMVALGCYVWAAGLIKPENILAVFKSLAPAGDKSVLQINQAALEEGQRLKNERKNI